MPFVDRLSTLDKGYAAGDLSIYPKALDTPSTLYTVANNAVTKTSQSAPYNAQYFVVDDTSAFPDRGVIMVGTEAVYYDDKTSNRFINLKRGFVGSRQEQWPIGTTVAAAVFAEPHNANRDALLNIENNLGLAVDPAPNSLNGLLVALENKFLAPRPLFRGMPLRGTAPLAVTFQNFSTGDSARYFWDFGDGSTSIEQAPTHTYLVNGTYTVELNMVTSLGGQGTVTKTGYITVGADDGVGFFYFTPSVGTTSTTFSFVDQTDGQITSRYWVWGDGQTTSQTAPDVHSAGHQYSASGEYNPSLLVVFADGSKRLVRSEDTVMVS